MRLRHVTFVGPSPADERLLVRLPANLAVFLRQMNGFVQFAGGLHVRGACPGPVWHSLADALDGEDAFHRLYPSVRSGDIPFAEDAFGDQFLLRDGNVWRLTAETGEIESLELGLAGFFSAIDADPDGFLALEPLLRFQAAGGRVEPGQLLAAWPPFCAIGDDEPLLSAVDAGDHRRFLASLAVAWRDVPEGGSLDVRVSDD